MDSARREPLRLFISYSHDDDALRAELENHLVSLKREGKIQTWQDGQIPAGDEWREQIAQRLNAADVILLLVSASFLASDQCWGTETARAIERHKLREARVIPIIVRSCDWETTPLGQLQALPKDGKAVTEWANRDSAWSDVVLRLRQVITEHRGHFSQRDLPAPTPLTGIGQEQEATMPLLGLLRRHRVELDRAGEDTREITNCILLLTRQLREGPRLQSGHFLHRERYGLLKEVGKGGYATIWKAFDTRNRKLVAIKVLLGRHGGDLSKRERFFRGARKMKALEHQHITRVLESGIVENGWCFFVMEYVPGGDFEQAVLQGDLTREQRLKCLIQVGEALEYTHRMGAVHRDVKPSNILLDGELQAKLTDFDQVRAHDTTGLTGAQARMGTTYFAAPETLESADDAGPRADLYSLAATAVFAVRGKVVKMLYRDPGGAIAELECGEELKRVLRRGIALDEEERFGSVREFCRAMEAAGFDPPPPTDRERVHYEAAAIDLELPYARRAIAAPPEIRRHVIDASYLIEDMTRGFIGRRWVFDLIDRFIEKESRGYFLLVGDPGIGKTALMAELVKRKGYIHHFNIRSQGLNRPENFLKNICAQLISKYNLEHTFLPPEAARDGRFLGNLLEQVSAELCGDDKAVLLIDALDEADPTLQPAGVNTLYLPATLPANIYVVAASRRTSRKLRVDCEQQELDLRQESVSNRADMKQYVENGLTLPGIRRYLAHQDLTEEAFIVEMVEKSQGNFMYLHHVMPAIAEGDYRDRDFATLPVGLENYYQDHWQLIRRHDELAWFDYKLPILVALTIVREPVSIDLIQDFSLVKRRSRIREILDEWAQFLCVTEATDDSGRPQNRYRFYSATFQGFIAGKDELAAWRVDFKDTYLQLADSLWEELFPEG